MKHEFRLADIGEGLEEAEIINWLVREGDRVARDQPLVEVMTDKSNAELPAPAGGTVVQLAGAVGDILTVGQLIAVIDDGAEAGVTAHEAPAAPADSADLVELTEGVETIETSASPPTRPTRIKASPATRRVAAERDIDLAGITGTGPGGRILLADLDPPEPAEPPAPTTSPAQPPEPAEPPAPAPAARPDSPDVLRGTVPLRGVRRAIAQNMARSWFDIPHIHAFEHVDAEPLLELRKRLRESGRVEYEALSPLAFFVAAVAAALRAHPQANASINMAQESITHHPSVDVGVAVAAPHGLVVPVLRSAGTLDFGALSRRLHELVTGAREGSLGREHFTGGTVTVTNFGSLGGEQATPLIRPPEAMIFGFGSIAVRPFVVDGSLVARNTMHLVVGADHRLLDGDVTTAVLRHVADDLTDPLRLILR